MAETIDNCAAPGKVTVYNDEQPAKHDAKVVVEVETTFGNVIDLIVAHPLNADTN
jgi:hypothetical protein